MADIIIQDLVKKKKDLLDELLQQSIHSLISGPDVETKLLRREKILADLERTDHSLQLREEQSGIKAVQQEKAVFDLIRGTLACIQENNEESIRLVEQEVKALEGEQINLGRERRISGYIQQGQMNRKNRAVAAL